VVRVKVTALPEVTDAEETVIRDVAVEGGPGMTVIVGNVEVSEEPPMVAPMLVGVPEARPVNVEV
jgi:hypothetical protein